MFFSALMWRVLTVVCVWVFVCVGVRLLGEWYNVFSRVVMFSVCTCFSCVRVCTPTHTILHTQFQLQHQHQYPHQKPTTPVSCHIMSRHMLCRVNTHRHTPHHHTQHLIGRSVCDGFLSCVWMSLFLFHCLSLKVCVCAHVWW